MFLLQSDCENAYKQWIDGKIFSKTGVTMRTSFASKRKQSTADKQTKKNRMVDSVRPKSAEAGPSGKVAIRKQDRYMR